MIQLTGNFSQLGGISAEFWQITGKKLALGNLSSIACNFSLASPTEIYRDLPLVNKSRKYCKNFWATWSTTSSRITIIAGICNLASCLAKPNPSQELNMANCQPFLIATVF